MPAQAVGHHPVLPIIADCPRTPAETGWGAWGAKSSSRVLDKFHKMVQSLSSWNTDTLPCARDEVLILVQNGFAKMYSTFAPPIAPLSWHPSFPGVLSSLLKMPVCGEVELCWSYTFSPSCFMLKKKELSTFQEYMGWEKKSRHSLL